MGILVTQHGTHWLIGLREEWFLKDKKDFDEVAACLNRLKVDIEVKYLNYCIKIVMNNSNIKFKDVEELKTELYKLLDYKIKFGQIILPPPTKRNKALSEAGGV